MRLSAASLRLSRSPALLALALPLAAALAFSDETLDKVPKSEGYCSRILRVQGTRREGYTEFSLRVEGDPDFYKPGTSYRGKWPCVALRARDPAPGGRRPRGAGGGRTVLRRTVRAQPGKGPSVLDALSPFRPEPVSGAVAGHSQEMQPPRLTRGSRAWAVAERRATLAWLGGNLASSPAGSRREVETRLSPDPSLEWSGPWLLLVGSQARW